MFHSARWKAYLHNLQSNGKDNGAKDETNDQYKTIYDIYHSQKLWFTYEASNGHQKAAEEHLRRSNDLMKDCTKKVDDLEETLANTPKPSQMMDWESVKLEDLI